MRRAVATLAGGRVTVHFGVRPAVNARVVLTYFRRVAGGAELGTARGGVGNIMRSVAGNARRAVLGVTQHRVGAGAKLHSFISMASEAGSRRRFCRVPTLGGPGVAVHTSQVFVNTVPQGGGVDRDGFSLRIHHPRPRPVAGKTVICGEKRCRIDEEGHNKRNYDIKAERWPPESLPAGQVLRPLHTGLWIHGRSLCGVKLGQNAHVRDRQGRTLRHDVGFCRLRND